MSGDAETCEFVGIVRSVEEPIGLGARSNRQHAGTKARSSMPSSCSVALEQRKRGAEAYERAAGCESGASLGQARNTTLSAA